VFLELIDQTLAEISKIPKNKLAENCLKNFNIKETHDLLFAKKISVLDLM